MIEMLSSKGINCEGFNPNKSKEDNSRIMGSRCLSSLVNRKGNRGENVESTLEEVGFTNETDKSSDSGVAAKTSDNFDLERF